MSSATDAEAPILRMENVSKSFAGIRAVQGLTLEVHRGTIHALIGPNGAGKTTVFNLVTKFHQPSGGRISFKGQDITFMTPSQISRLGIGRSFQISAVFGSLTALFLGIMTFLIYAMDHPLQGAVSVGPEPYQSVYDLVMKWDEPS